MSAPLETTQHRFAAALLDVDDEAPLLAELTGDDRARLATRFAFYRGNLREGWIKALGNAYPVLQQLVGDECFAALAQLYGDAHPSTCGDLNRFGDLLPEFVAACGALDDYPYLPDVARLEWTLHRAHYAADAQPLEPAQLAALGDALSAARCTLHPACSAFASRFAAVPVWQAHRRGGAAAWHGEVDVDAPSWGLIARPRWQALVEPITQATCAAVQALARGETFDDAFAAALTVDAAYDPTLLLRTLLSSGALVGVHAED